MARQSPRDRAIRLKDGRCPVHGIGMPQVDSWYCPKHGDTYRCSVINEHEGTKCDAPHYTIVGCPRKDCSIQAKALGADGPWETLPEFGHLFHDDLVHG